MPPSGRVGGVRRVGGVGKRSEVTSKMEATLTELIQTATGTGGTGQGLAVGATLSTALLILVLFGIQAGTDRNIWDFLAQIDGIGLIAIGTSITILVTFTRDDFELLRVHGAVVAGLLILLVAWRSDHVSTVYEYAAWFSIDGALRLILVTSMLTTAVVLVIEGPSAIGVGEYLAGFPLAGLAILAIIALVPIQKLKEKVDD